MSNTENLAYTVNVCGPVKGLYGWIVLLHPAEGDPLVLACSGENDPDAPMVAYIFSSETEAFEGGERYAIDHMTLSGDVPLGILKMRHMEGQPVSVHAVAEIPEHMAALVAAELLPPVLGEDEAMKTKPPPRDISSGAMDI